MAAILSTDPLTSVLAKLWDIAKAWAPLELLINDGNRLDFTELPPSKIAARLNKTSIQHADRLEAALFVESGLGNYSQSSSSTLLVQTYTWRLTSASQNIGVDGAYMDAMWHLWRAMLHWNQPGGLTDLTFNNRSYVKKFDLVAFTTGLQQDQQTKNILGWAGVLSYEAQMIFNRTDLLNVNL